jgi:hypothetical protein
MKYIEAIVLGCVVWMAAPDLLAAAPSGQYTVKNGTVKDNKTGLVWQQAVMGEYSWTSAERACAGLSLGGFSSDWRLPRKLELESLVDYRVAEPGPTIDSTVFLTPGGRFWTSTPFAGDSEMAWYVNFYKGFSYNGPTTESYWVRCVREDKP